MATKIPANFEFYDDYSLYILNEILDKTAIDTSISVSANITKLLVDFETKKLISPYQTLHSHNFLCSIELKLINVFIDLIYQCLN